MTGRLRIRLKRAYEAPDPADGRRYLVERLWPRGVTREKAALDGWLRDLAPSPALRQWFREDKSRWAEFCTRYRAELAGRTETLLTLRAEAARTQVTFVYAATDPEKNSAGILRDYLESL